MLTISNNLYKELGSFLNMNQQSSSSDNNNNSSSNESNNNVKDRFINNMAEIIIDIVDKPTLQKALTTLASRFIKSKPFQLAYQKSVKTLGRNSTQSWNHCTGHTAPQHIHTGRTDQTKCSNKKYNKRHYSTQFIFVISAIIFKYYIDIAHITYHKFYRLYFFLYYPHNVTIIIDHDTITVLHKNHLTLVCILQLKKIYWPL